MYGLVNDAAYSSACIVSNGETISEKLIHKFEERIDCVLIVETVQAHAWRDQRVLRKTYENLGPSEYETWVLTTYP